MARLVGCIVIMVVKTSNGKDTVVPMTGTMNTGEDIAIEMVNKGINSKTISDFEEALLAPMGQNSANFLVGDNFCYELIQHDGTTMRTFHHFN